MNHKYNELVENLLENLPEGIHWNSELHSIVLDKYMSIPQILCDRLNDLVEECSSEVHAIDIETYDDCVHIQILPLQLSCTCRDDAMFECTHIAYRICNGSDVELYRQYGIVPKKPDRIEPQITPDTKNQINYCYNSIFGFYDLNDAEAIQKELEYENPHIICFRIDDIEYWWDDLIMQKHKTNPIKSTISSNIRVAPERIEYIKEI